jgi:hypothetical protein
MGVLYDAAIPALVVFSVAVQIAAIILLLATKSRTRAGN